MDLSLPGSTVHGDSPGKNTGVDCQALLQGIFPTQGSNPCPLCLLHWQAGSLLLVPPVKPLVHCGMFFQQLQMVNNLSAMQQTWVQFLGQEDPLRPTPVFLPGEFHGWKTLVGYSPWGSKELDRTERLTLSLSSPFSTH